MLNLKIMLVW